MKRRLKIKRARKGRKYGPIRTYIKLSQVLRDFAPGWKDTSAALDFFKK